MQREPGSTLRWDTSASRDGASPVPAGSPEPGNSTSRLDQKGRDLKGRDLQQVGVLHCSRSADGAGHLGTQKRLKA